MNCFIDFFFPKSCVICKKSGGYLCNTCKKLFKNNLPECYVCRRISNLYVTHSRCKTPFSFEWVFVAWEYNKLTSQFIKQYKYKNVYDMQRSISIFFLDAFKRSGISKSFADTLLVPIPISSVRKSERGFNQMAYISKYFGSYFKLDVSESLLGCNTTFTHQASRNQLERLNSKNTFFIKKKIDISKYKSITLLDDVITTGATLAHAGYVIKQCYGAETKVNALCMYRGKPRY